MKLLLVSFLSLLSLNAFSLTKIDGVFDKKTNTLHVRLQDHGFMFPYEAADLYNQMKGFDTSTKFFNKNGVKMECDSRRVSGKGTFGDCKVSLDGSFVRTQKGYYIFKLQGQSAWELFREFHSVKSLNFVNATAYLTMIEGRNEFIFGVKTSVIKVER